MEIFYVALLLAAVYIYTDRLLFRGRLGALVLRGFRELLRGPQRNDRPGEPLSENRQPQALHADDLIPKRWYKPTPKVPEDAPGGQAKANPPAGHIFAPGESETPPAQEAEWRAYSFRQGRSTSLSAADLLRGQQSPVTSARIMPRGEEGDFDVEQVADTEELRRQVAQELEAVREEAENADLEPTEEEKFGIEGFDAGNFR